MNRCHDDEYDDDDEMLNDSISEDDPDGLSLADDDEMRSARIEELRHAALRHDNPLRANLGAVTAGLLEIASRYETAVKNALMSAAGNIVDSPHVQRGIGTHLNITRQVERYANLELRLDAEQREAESRAQRRVAAVPAPARAANRRGMI